MDLIFNRTLADVNYLLTLSKKGWNNLTYDEQNYWLRGSSVSLYATDGMLYGSDGELQYRDNIIKGSYKYTDLNRVENAILAVQTQLQSIGINTTLAYTPQLNWDGNDILNETEWELYRQNVVIIRNAINVLTTTPTVPASLESINYIMANALENILIDIEEIISKMSTAYLYTGITYTGGYTN